MPRSTKYAGFVVSCDGRCYKAWGINDRPKRQLSDNEDDYVFLGDEELGRAPFPSGTSEGGECKPCGTTLRNASLMNKWCARQCERSLVTSPSAPVVLPNMLDPKPNIRR